MRKFVKILTLLLCFSVMAIATAHISNAASYNYDFWKNALPSAEGLSYKDTYYGKDVQSINDSNKTLTFNTLEDMDIYNNEIFLLDSKSDTASQIELSINGGKAAKFGGVSTITILNEEMKYIQEPIFEFEITKHVFDKLKEYYKVKTDLADITAEQVNKQLTDVKSGLKVPYIPLTTISSALEGTEDYSGASILFTNASGITVVPDEDSYVIYVADTGNSRIVKMTADYIVTEVYLTPTDEVFYQWNVDTDLEHSTKRVFQPAKVAVDKTGRVYCIANNCYEGIIEYNRGGKFNRFLGQNTVVANPLKQFWYKLMSEAQISSQALTLPPLFINFTIDKAGFIYATSYPDADDALAKNMIKSINTAGKDVLRKNGYVEPNGDAVFLAASTNPEAVLGASTLTSIAVSEDGFYSVTDTKRGRIFTYDTEGNLLYISGEKGSLSNSLNQPVAIQYLTIEGTDTKAKQELVLVIDKTSKSIITYSTSDFGALVNKATKLYLENDIIGAEQYWREVVKMNSNYELGYVGIGKSLLRQEKFEEAMEYFKLGHNAVYYSKAYQQYRDIVLKDNFSLIMSGLVITGVGLCVLFFFKYQNKKKLGYKKEGGK